MSFAADIIMKHSDEDGAILQGQLAEEIERMTPSQCQAFADDILQHQIFKSKTIGLWATDQPTQLQDPNQVLFEIK